MPYEYRVTEAADGTFPVELWSSKGEREQLLYKTQGFETRELAEAWISPAREVPVQVQYDDRPKPRARVTYLKPRRFTAGAPGFLNFSQSGDRPEW